MPVWTRLRRWAFWVYAAALFTATHWPSLRIGGAEGTDKTVHIAAFGLWTMLLIAAGLFGPSLSWRNILAVLVIAPVYAAIDESSQAIPVLHRSAEFADYFANLKGIGAAFALAALLAIVFGARGRGGPVSSPPP